MVVVANFASSKECSGRSRFPAAGDLHLDCGLDSSAAAGDGAVLRYAGDFPAPDNRRIVKDRS